MPHHFPSLPWGPGHFSEIRATPKNPRRGRVVVPGLSLKDASRAQSVHQPLFYISDLSSERPQLYRGLIKFCLNTPWFPREVWQIPPKTELPTGQHSHIQSSSASAPQGIFSLYEFLQQLLQTANVALH